MTCCECVSKHFILSVGLDSTKIFSEAPDLKLMGAKGKLLWTSTDYRTDGSYSCLELETLGL